MSKLSIEQLNASLRAYFQEQLNKALLITFDLPSDPSVDLEAEIAGLQGDVKNLTRSLMTRTFDIITRADAEEIIRAQASSDTFVPLDTIEYVRGGVARARIERANYLARALSGDHAGNIPSDPMFAGMQPVNFDAEGGHGTAPLTLGIARQQFIEMKMSGNEWVRKTELDYRRVLELAVSVIGENKLVAVLSTEDIKRVRDTLAILPSNIAKMKGNKARSVSELIAENQAEPRMSARTQDKYFSMFKSFLQWLVNEEAMAKVPGANIKVAGAGKIGTKGDRQPYSSEQLQQIFSSPLYRGSSSRERRSSPGPNVFFDAYYWVPLVALFTGMRLGEIVQLRTKDIKQEGGVWYFDVSLGEGDDKHLKTAASQRRVPMHSKLIELGLLDRVEKALASKKLRVFHEIEAGQDGYYSHNFSKWWGRYARKIKVHTARTPFHSFRHNFTDALREAEVPENIAKALVGHADNSVHAGYGKGVSLAKLAENLNKISYAMAL